MTPYPNPACTILLRDCRALGKKNTPGEIIPPLPHLHTLCPHPDFCIHFISHAKLGKQMNLKNSISRFTFIDSGIWLTASITYKLVRIAYTLFPARIPVINTQRTFMGLVRCDKGGRNSQISAYIRIIWEMKRDCWTSLAQKILTERPGWLHRACRHNKFMGKLACCSEYTQSSTGGSLGTRLPGIHYRWLLIGNCW